MRVIGVLRQFQPQLDIILIVSDDERLKHSGIAAGMSGSPIHPKASWPERWPTAGRLPKIPSPASRRSKTSGAS